MRKTFFLFLLLISMQSFASLNIAVNAAKKILFNGKQMNFLEGRVDIDDSSSDTCNVQIFSNFEGHLAVTIGTGKNSQNMNIKNSDNSSELKFRNNLIVLTNSLFTAKIYLSNNVDGEVKKIELKQSGYLPSFHNYSCEF